MDATDVLVANGESANPQSDAGYLDGLPCGLVDAQLIEAEQDAFRVNCFLEAFMAGLAAQFPEGGERLNWRRAFSAKTLLELAAAVRVLEWEHRNLIRKEMQLPSGQQAIRQALLNANKDELQSDLSLRLVKVFAENFAWASMRDLGAHVLLDKLSAEEDELADYIARFLVEAMQHEVTKHG